ncbi:MAG: AAA family ATPase, partial [Gammaproteobacteria bacterium]|nr:AAA family ATPase [Gammaproteobacteria bacterium]
MNVATRSTAGRFDHVTFISAGAGSGKTYRLIDELEKAIVEDAVPPAGILATTFTVKAATELRERVRDRLLAHGRLDLAERTAESLIGTVHGVCERLLKRFAFELGLSPQSNVMSIDDGARFFNQALDRVLPIDRVREMNAYVRRLGILDRGLPTWQSLVKAIADKARENNLRDDALRAMGKHNADDLLAFLPAPSNEDPTQALVDIVTRTIRELPQGSYKGIDKYRALLEDQEADLNEPDCPWSVWMRLAGTSSLKSIVDEVGRVQSAAARYASHPGFHQDLRGYTQGLFEIAADTLERFQAAKRERGLIDFNDMEQLMLQALDEEAVRTRLAGEIELLLVDEFQDTDPMQLALFLKFAALADKAIFVGDVKQAIYEFRGCDPTLVFDTLDGLTAGDAQRHT